VRVEDNRVGHVYTRNRWRIDRLLADPALAPDIRLEDIFQRNLKFLIHLSRLLSVPAGVSLTLGTLREPDRGGASVCRRD